MSGESNGGDVSTPISPHYLDEMLAHRAEARRIRLRHDSNFYGPMKDATCGCDLCQWLRRYLEATEKIDALVRERERHTDALVNIRGYGISPNNGYPVVSADVTKVAREALDGS